MTDNNAVTDRALTMAVLANADSTLMQLTQAINELEKSEFSRTLKIGISSSSTSDLLGLFLRKQGLLNGARIEIVSGNYNDPIGDVRLFQQAGVAQMVLLPFFDGLLPAFEAQLERLSSETIDACEKELRMRYRLVFEQARSMHCIYLGGFHRMAAPAECVAQDIVTQVLTRYNLALQEEAAAFENIRWIDTEDVVATVGRRSAFDSRFYFRNKAPYTPVYMNELARRIAAAARGFGAHFYKVLVLDCDNTLWGGVIGEDLMSGIKLGPHDYPGNIYWRMQHEFAALERRGVVLCLCTKNNPADIDEVLRDHPAMVLRNDDFVIKKVNWEDKPSNLRAIAKALNLGLDSIVFLDDSSFECEAVRQQLPMVKTVQVPSAINTYPAVVQTVKELFVAGGMSADGQNKTTQYKQRAAAENQKAEFETQEAYLASLELKVELSRNAKASVARISELSQKSNQFNLTTTRYSVAEISRMMEGDDHAVYSLAVSDKFGPAGLTGVAVMRYSGEIACIENFFMSCRVIGRGVETCIWARILADAKARGCQKLQAQYIPSAKNAQVADFYDRLGLRLESETASGARCYDMALDAFPDNAADWIELSYVE